jgi:hypothetical protein
MRPQGIGSLLVDEHPPSHTNFYSAFNVSGGPAHNNTAVNNGVNRDSYEEHHSSNGLHHRLDSLQIVREIAEGCGLREIGHRAEKKVVEFEAVMPAGQRRRIDVYYEAGEGI